ncbi:uncharacterized protein LOC128240552 [Mya arenaria]|uniref:uncharacterized protein LOC128240552 n=1 Tax=Mya arenaria TaxID=6604 RepID=UPI0022E7EB6E|nr:uncharacterized protein LOC128240552 [Mya arenaria]
MRVETRGKRTRKVAIIFTKAMKANIDLLLKMHDKMGIVCKYVFVPQTTNQPYRGCSILKEMALEANLQHPERVTSTNLRKQLGTMCQLLGLTETEQDVLAKFMGHDIRVHREFYRLPQSTIEIAKVTKVLHLLNAGQLSEVQGKDLDQIDVEIELEEDTDDESDLDVDQKDTDHCHKQQKPQKVNKRQNTMPSDTDEDDSDAEWQPPKKQLFAAIGSDSE